MFLFLSTIHRETTGRKILGELRGTAPKVSYLPSCRLPPPAADKGTQDGFSFGGERILFRKSFTPLL